MLRPSVIGFVLSGRHRTAKILAEDRSLNVLQRAELIIKARPFLRISPDKLARAMLVGTLLEPLHRAGLLAAGFEILPSRRVAGHGISGVTDAWVGAPLDAPAEFKSPRRFDWNRDLPGWLLQLGAYKVAAGQPEGPALLSVVPRERLAHWVCVVDVDESIVDAVALAERIWRERIEPYPPDDLSDDEEDLFVDFCERCKPVIESVSCAEISAVDEETTRVLAKEGVDA